MAYKRSQRRYQDGGEIPKFTPERLSTINSLLYGLIPKDKKEPLVDLYNALVDFKNRRGDGEFSPEELDLRKRIAEAQSFGYPTSLKDLTRFVDRVKAGKKQGFFIPPDRKVQKARKEFINKYYGIPEDRPRHLVKSQYKPTRATDPDATYYTIGATMKERAKRRMNTPGAFDYAYESAQNPSRNIFQKRRQMYKANMELLENYEEPRLLFGDLLGKHQLSTGTDEKGRYISVYDKWDIDPPFLKDKGIDVDQLNYPFEIYDRFYESEFNNNPMARQQTVGKELPQVKGYYDQLPTRGQINPTDALNYRYSHPMMNSNMPVTIPGTPVQDWWNKFNSDLNRPTVDFDPNTPLAPMGSRGSVPLRKKGGSMYIEPSRRGSFTRWAKRHGHDSVQAAANAVMSNKDRYSPAIVKKANFAKNFGGKKRQDGGELTPLTSIPPSFDAGKLFVDDKISLRKIIFDNIQDQKLLDYQQRLNAPFKRVEDEESFGGNQELQDLFSPTKDKKKYGGRLKKKGQDGLEIPDWQQIANQYKYGIEDPVANLGAVQTGKGFGTYEIDPNGGAPQSSSLPFDTVEGLGRDPANMSRFKRRGFNLVNSDIGQGVGNFAKDNAGDLINIANVGISAISRNRALKNLQTGYDPTYQSFNPLRYRSRLPSIQRRNEQSYLASAESMANVTGTAGTLGRAATFGKMVNANTSAAIADEQARGQFELGQQRIGTQVGARNVAEANRAAQVSAMMQNQAVAARVSATEATSQEIQNLVANAQQGDMQSRAMLLQLLSTTDPDELAASLGMTKSELLELAGVKPKYRNRLE
ncbi:hypothetical protein LCGC14_0246400 [marine sediment metagenome]|uniref:Uncharacterized protein n=1 Tax=marine sediment metagenome TaxID=412755 RepID=A0A0F9UAS7_9ZZZZ